MLSTAQCIRLGKTLAGWGRVGLGGARRSERLGEQAVHVVRPERGIGSPLMRFLLYLSAVREKIFNEVDCQDHALSLRPC